MTIPPLSLLDLSPVPEGSSVGEALRASRRLAQAAERQGYRRFWMAEHHNMPGIASSATAVALGFVAEGTTTLKVGAGGIMLPNHAPLVIAEQFGALAELYPGRIELGLGRAPGTDQVTAHALRRTLQGDVDRFPNDVIELMQYFAPAQPNRRVRAIPGEGTEVPVWILGSSTYGAQLAAMLGLPYAFASHFAPQEMEAAIRLYRTGFKPSAVLDKPYLMLGLNALAADTDAEAQFLASSQQLSFIRLRTGDPGRLPPPVTDLESQLAAEALPLLRSMRDRAVVGSPATVKAGLEAFAARTGADEIMVTAQIYDETARLRSFELIAEVGISQRAPISAVAAP